MRIGLVLSLAAGPAAVGAATPAFELYVDTDDASVAPSGALLPPLVVHLGAATDPKACGALCGSWRNASAAAQRCESFTLYGTTAHPILRGKCFGHTSVAWFANPSSGNATSGRMLWPCSGALDCSLNGHCGAGGRCTCSVGWKGLKCGELDVLAVNKSQLGFVPAGSGSSWGGAVTRSHHDTAGERILYPTVHSMAPPPISAGLSCPRLATETLSCDRLEDVRGKDDQQLRNQQLVDEQSDRTSSRPVAFRSVHRGRDSGAHVARLFDRAWYCTGSERGACGGSDDGRGERQCERCTIHQLHGWEHAAWPWLSAPGANSHDLFTSCTQCDTDIRPWLPRPCESFDLKRQLTLCCFALFYRGASAILDQYRDAVIRRPG